MKRSFPIQSGPASAGLAGDYREAFGSSRLIRIAAAALLLASSTPAVFAEESNGMELTGVKFDPPSGEDAILRADFFLQQPNLGTSLAQPDWVVPPVKVTANKEPLPDNNVLFTKTTDLPNYSCAVLLLVDNTLAKRQGVDQKIKDRVTAQVRNSVLQFTKAAGTPPYNFEIAAISNGNAPVLATMGSDKALLTKAAQSIKFDGDSPSLYLELMEAIKAFTLISADRKFVVLFSDGVSNDQANIASAVDVIAAALQAKVHICSIGFPTVAGSNVVQALEPLADKTGGTWVEASPSKLELPNGIEDSLLKLMTSGGQLQVKLAGLHAPLDLSFAIQTHLTHLYTITHRVDSLPVPPPRPSPTLTPTPTPTPKPTPLSPLDVAKSWVISNTILLSLVAGAILVGLVLLIVLIRRRAAQHAIAEAAESAQSVTPPDLPSPSEAAPLAWLESLDSDQTRYPISKTAVRIGRKPDNDIVMKNDTISSHHAEILKRGSEFVIADLGSSNQVFVGGKQVQRTSLQDGDIIELGEVRLRFLQAQPADPDYRTLKIS
jgi:hypothetical protein